MPYRVNRVIDKGEYERHHPAVRHYIESLRERGLLIEMDNVFVDADQLGLRTFQCNSGYCVKCSGEGAGRSFKGSCCTDLQVDIIEAERDKIVELAGMARERLEFKGNDPLKRIVDRALKGEIAEVNEAHELIFRHKKDGTCVMAWTDPAGKLYCGINSLAWKLGVPLEEYKPSPCYLFPLHYCEWDQGKILVSLLTEETRYWAGHHQQVTRLRCLKKPEPGAPPAYVSLKGEIELCFGKKFFAELEARIKPIMEREFARASEEN